ACAAIERLDVLEHVLDARAVDRHLSRGQRVEHERVVGIGTVTNADRLHRGLLAGKGRASRAILTRTGEAGLEVPGADRANDRVAIARGVDLDPRAAEVRGPVRVVGGDP